MRRLVGDVWELLLIAVAGILSLMTVAIALVAGALVLVWAGGSLVAWFGTLAVIVILAALLRSE